MSDSDGSNEIRGAWVGLIHRSLDSLRKVFPFKTTISSEAEFRPAFWELPQEYNGPSIDRNYAQFNRRHGQMLYIVRGLDIALGLVSPNSLNDVFWTYALAGLKVAMDKQTQFIDIVAIYINLNNTKAIPVISSDLPQFPRSRKVQSPLQSIFEIYIDCYLTFIKQFAAAEEYKGVDLPSITATFQNAIPRFAASEKEWRESIQEEKDNQISFAIGGDAGPVVHHRDKRFEFIRNLGSGTYGSVDEVREVTTGSMYARKSVPIQAQGQNPDAIKARVKNEVDIMSKKLRHNHIASVNIYFREDIFWSMIMLPVADCDLRVFLDQKCVAEDYPLEAMRMLDPWFGCLISALAYAHTEMVKHEDIKPNNILIKEKKIYLTDFGTAKDFSEMQQSTVSDFLVTGTPVYWAPERRPWGRTADVFALGCVFAEMLTVRQKRNLDDFREYRKRPSEFGLYAFKNNLPRVRKWLIDLPGINSSDPVAMTILEQTLNMLLEDPQNGRLEAPRVKKNLKIEWTLFCDTCY